MAMFVFFHNEPRLENVVSCSPLDTISCPDKPFGDHSAEEFLDFARKDLLQGAPRGLVNALGNAKRAFHYQSERLLYRYGLRSAFAKEDFPRKVALLEEVGILSGTLLRAFNGERNTMEDEFALPSNEIAAGVIDLCELQLLATERFIRETPGRLRVKCRDDKGDLVLLVEPGTR